MSSEDGIVLELGDVINIKIKDEPTIQGIEPFLIFIRDAMNEANIGAIISTAEAAGADRHPGHHHGAPVHALP